MVSSFSSADGGPCDPGSREGWSPPSCLGAVLGYEREHEGKAAGMRTHMLVALGAAIFTLVPIETGMNVEDLSRVVQGRRLSASAFSVAGTILHLSQETPP